MSRTRFGVASVTKLVTLDMDSLSALWFRGVSTGGVSGELLRSGSGHVTSSPGLAVTSGVVSALARWSRTPEPFGRLTSLTPAKLFLSQNLSKEKKVSFSKMKMHKLHVNSYSTASYFKKVQKIRNRSASFFLNSGLPTFQILQS